MSLWSVGPCIHSPRQNSGDPEVGNEGNRHDAGMVSGRTRCSWR